MIKLLPSAEAWDPIMSLFFDFTLLFPILFLAYLYLLIFLKVKKQSIGLNNVCFLWALALFVGILLIAILVILLDEWMGWDIITGGVNSGWGIFLVFVYVGPIFGAWFVINFVVNLIRLINLMKKVPNSNE